MDRDTRGRIEQATQKIRRLLEDEYTEQLEGTFDILLSGRIAADGGRHLGPRERITREKLLVAIRHKEAGGMGTAEAVADYRRDAAFTTLNRFVALKMLEARELVQECISRGDRSSGFKEFCGLAQPLSILPDERGYRLYIESIFDELSQEVKVLFDRRDPASLLWPRRQVLASLLEVINESALASVWEEDETVGWVYQFYNSVEERRQMRHSRTPRNSRESAVRNQFFTPRYVVQFLTDNTLGRLWCDMCNWQSSLVQECRYIVKNHVHSISTNMSSRSPQVPAGANEAVAMTARPDKKDPRDLKIIDPACGSGHFLLYSFDVLLIIYQEAWNQADARASSMTGRTLREDYEDLQSLQASIPSLILRHNLHGIDIDPRCAQIAALSLWMRAKRAFHDLSVPMLSRSTVSMVNVIVAEPLPGEKLRRDEFLASLDRQTRQLCEVVFNAMEVAGEAGILLKIDERVHCAIRDIYPDRGELFLSVDEADWVDVERTVISKLREYAKTRDSVVGYSPRLFSEDAVRGVNLISMCQQRYDVVLMNPPFGHGSDRVKRIMAREFPRGKQDLYSAFVERGVQLLSTNGYIGALTSRTCLFASSFRTWREEVFLGEVTPTAIADLGGGVLDQAMVETVAYCLCRRDNASQSTIVDVRNETQKSAALLHAMKVPDSTRVYCVNPISFRNIVGSPIAYWLSPSIVSAFQALRPLQSNDCQVRRGAYTTDDFRFNRLTWEVGCGEIGLDRPSFVMGKEFANLAKGGEFSRFHSDLHLLLRWSGDGREAKALLVQYRESKGWGSDWSACLNGYTHYFRPGLTYSLRSQKGLSFRVLPRGCIFSLVGPALFVEGDSPVRLLALLAILNSSAFRVCVAAQMAFGTYQVGVIQQTPIPEMSPQDESELAELAMKYFSCKHRLDFCSETSHVFELPALLQSEGHTLVERASWWTTRNARLVRRMEEIIEDIDELSQRLYCIPAEDCQINSNVFTDVDEGQGPEECDYPIGCNGLHGSGDEAELPEGGLSSMVASLVSWAVGVVFGRFDIRLKESKETEVLTLDPFCEPPLMCRAMLVGRNGLPATECPSDYPLTLTCGGVAVDDERHMRDLSAQIRNVFRNVFGDYEEQAWVDAASVLDPCNSSIRAWIRRSFLEFHISQYSKSRRKAPIFWQCATLTASYSVWLYYHGLTRDTFYRILNDFVKPKVAYEEHGLDAILSESGTEPTAPQRKQLDTQARLVEELRDFRDEIARIAPLWNPDLNDGVIINFAPLWRLVPQHRVWQKECKETWDKLCSGDYDWAHLAMHLWPERVVPKCQIDRSLAIAHGLEEAFWYEEGKGKWKPLKVSDAQVKQMVEERTSRAVKDALQGLLDAPVPGGASRGRKRK